MNKKRRKKKLAILVIVPLLFFTIRVAKICFNATNQMNHAITIKTDKKLFFYRPDCQDCKKVFGKVYKHNLIYDDVFFVNLNHEKNRKYIKQYDVQSVPTILDKEKGKREENVQKIEEFLTP